MSNGAFLVEATDRLLHLWRTPPAVVEYVKRAMAKTEGWAKVCGSPPFGPKPQGKAE